MPLSLVVVLVTGAMWLNSVSGKADANAAENISLRADLDKEVTAINDSRRDGRKEIIDRLNILDAKMDRLLSRQP